MVVGEEQKRHRIKQKKRKSEESPHSNMVVVPDLDEQQTTPKDSSKKMKNPHSNMLAEESPHSNAEEQISPKDSGKKKKKKKNPHSNMVAEESPCSNDEEQISPKDSGKKMKKEEYCEGEECRARENKLTHESNALPSCIDKLREELSCPICLEICYEPTSLWCGHSYCIRCLRLAVIECGNECPKCQEFIRKGRPYVLNTVVWNTIQLLYPQEVEARKVAIMCEQESVCNASR